MRIEAIEEALQAKPFVPFRLVLPSDRALPVPHSEFVSMRRIESGCWSGTSEAVGA